MPNIGLPNQMAPDPQAPGAANMPLQVNPMAPMSPADVYNYNAANLGDAWKAAQDPQTWTDAAQAYSQAMLAGSIGPEGKGFTAYHGSPHMFDQFDASKIGTGEGAQAYGHGMYLADNEGVARSYRDQLANQQPVQLNADDYGLPQATVDQIVQGNMRQVANMGGDRTFIQQALDGLGNRNDPASRVARDTYTNLLNQQGGHMYEVNVNADPAKFLDWDAPLSQQHPDVQAALADSWMAHPIDHAKMTGAQIYNAQQGSSADIAAALQQAGIPGIRYLDQGSRNVQVLSPRQTTSGQWITKQVPNGNVLYRGDDEVAARAAGQGTRNSVVFDPATMNIIRRYGLAGLLGGGAAAAATQQPSQ